MTHELCDFAPRPWEREEYFPLQPNATYADEACVDRVLADFEVDVDAFLAVDGLEDPYGAVRQDPDVWKTRLGGLLSAAWALHAFDWGPVSDVREGPAIDPAFVEEMGGIADEGCADDLGAALYEYVTRGLVATVPGEGDEFAATRGGGTLTLYSTSTGALGVAALVHEARHDDGSHRHTRCDDGVRACDRDLEGAYGFQAAVVAAALSRVDDTHVATHFSTHLETILERIQP